MTSYLMFGPAVEPVTLTEVREFCGLMGEADDGMLSTYIFQARQHVEEATGRALITQGWQMALHGWPASLRVSLPFAPITKLAVRLHQADGATRFIVPAVLDDEGGVIALPRLHRPPALRPLNGIEIDYEAGYGPTPDDVPEGLRVAVLLQVAHLLRAGVTAAAWVPSSVNYLTQKYRRAA